MSHPDAERQIILLSAGTKTRREAERGRAIEFAKQVDWERLANSLYQRRLLPTLGPRIIDVAPDYVSGDFVARVDRAVEVGRRRGAFLQLISEQLMNALAAASLPCAPLKGSHLSETLYGDLGRRLASDIDLLVPQDRLQTAVEIVREFGYGPPIDHVDQSGLPQLHFALSHESEELPPVELHWRIHWYERSFAEKRLLPPVGAQRTWRPTPIDEVAALLLLYARDGFIDLRLATDIGTWWDIHGDELRGEDFTDLLQSYPALRRPLLAATMAAERVVGLSSARILEKPLKLDLRGRMAVRLADPNPNPRSRQSQIHAAMGLVDGLLMPKGELSKFVTRQVLLPGDVLDEQAQKLRRMPRSQINHGIRVIARIGIASTRLARMPETMH